MLAAQAITQLRQILKKPAPQAIAPWEVDGVLGAVRDQFEALIDQDEEVPFCWDLIGELCKLITKEQLQQAVDNVFHHY